MCITVLSACMCMYHMCACSAQGGESQESLGTGVRSDKWSRAAVWVLETQCSLSKSSKRLYPGVISPASLMQNIYTLLHIHIH